MPHDPLGEPPCLEQALEIDAGGDAETLTQEDYLLRCDVSRGACVACERTAPEPPDRALETINAFEKTCIYIRHAEPACIVQVKANPHPRPTLAHRGDRPSDQVGIRPPHRIGEINQSYLSTRVLGNLDERFDPFEDARKRDRPFVIAAERRHDIAGCDRKPEFAVERAHVSGGAAVLFERALLIAQSERFGCRDAERPGGRNEPRL